ncbi:MAG: carbohydrate kinase [Oscillatoriales cyanobacterium C42_A2020_001]|nr:carbohydrate kinase [Leptolyngbyaceae cyanobacterium C42_A2020_001]
MNHPRVLCLGEILFDFLSNQPGVPYEQVTSWTPYPGGAPANVACALTKLGTSSGFVGAVGVDETGHTLVNLLNEIGVNTEGVQRHPTAPTRGVYVVRSEAGDRAFAGFGHYDTSEFADTHLQADKLPVHLFEKADFLVLGTLEMAYPESRDAMLQALSLADQYYTKVLLDVNWRPVFWHNPAEAPAIIHRLMQHADFIKLSDEEAELLFETTDPGIIAHRIETAEGVLVTAGAKGCAYYLAENQGSIPAFQMSVVDTTGAGDSFVAGFIHQLALRGLKSLADPEQARQIITYASVVGALTTTKAGAIAAQPTADEVDDFLRKNQ